MDRIHSSLTVRIFLITAAILFAACAATYLFMVWAMPISFYSITSDVTTEKADILINNLQKVSLQDSGPLFDRFLLDTGASVRVVDEQGNVIHTPSAVVQAQAVDSDVVVTITEGSAIVTADSTAEGNGHVDNEVDNDVDVVEDVAIISASAEIPFRFSGSDELYYLSVTSNATAVNQAASAMRQVMPYLALVVLIISFLGAVIYSRYITRPIVRLSNISQKMADLDFSWECCEQRKDEIGVLGQNLDQLSHRLSTALTELTTANAALQEDIHRERELERQRSAFFAAASHELKTPITVLRGQLSGMLAGVDIYQDRDKYLARSLAVTGSMETLVQEMLMISRMEREGSTVRQDVVQLSSLMQKQIEMVEDLTLQREQTLCVDIASDLTVTGDGTLLGRAIVNLLTNALNYSPPGSTVVVRLEATQSGARLVVENGGVHIPEEAIPHLFEAFYRVEASRNRETGGSGLGLYLVKMILDRHGAECGISNTSTGVRATIRFRK